MHSLASDNYAAVHPEVMAALAAANEGHVPSYGADPVTERAIAAMRADLGADAEIGFVFNGTGANVVGLQLMLHPWQHVVCARTAHINVDECGAPERLIGAKLLDLETPDGKLTPEAVRAVHTGIGVEHHTQPRVVSISQSTELGTVYTAEEIGALADTAHSLDMYLHLDGARIANAAAGLDAALATVTCDAGVDVMSFGGTKNGLLGGEAVVVFADELKPAFPFVRKQFMQLGSKGRFIAAQFLALFTGELWRRNALHANAMAARLHDRIAGLDGVRVTQARQANVVFATLPPAVVAPLQAVAPFYLWNEDTTEARLMCSWDTTPAQVDGFAAALRELTG
ncbi:MAG: beta-eliminating lyase-related protein [Kineosporiaceae bacterium]